MTVKLTVDYLHLCSKMQINLCYCYGAIPIKTRRTSKLPPFKI